MNPPEISSAHCHGRNWLELVGADGARSGLREAIHELVGALANLEEQFESDVPRRDQESLARQLYELFETPKVQERVRALEHLVLGTAFISPSSDAPMGPDPRDQRQRLLLYFEPDDRIGVSGSSEPPIGCAHIGGQRVRAWLPVVHNAAALRATGDWRKLPVGCVLLGGARASELAIIGESVIAWDLRHHRNARARDQASHFPNPPPAEDEARTWVVG